METLAYTIRDLGMKKQTQNVYVGRDGHCFIPSAAQKQKSIGCIYGVKNDKGNRI